MIEGLKRKLWEECIMRQQKLADTAYHAMIQAQESANEQKGTMGDKFESFREQMQIDRDMYARQYQEALTNMNILKKIDPDKEQELVSLGSIVLSGFQNLFISGSLGRIELPEGEFVAVSVASPIYKVLAGKRKGDGFMFREKQHSISDIF